MDKRTRNAREAKAKREAEAAEGMRAWAEAEAAEGMRDWAEAKARSKSEIARIAAEAS